MINVEAAFVILSNATDPELCSALQQNSGLRRRIQRILEIGPPRGSNARLQSAPQHRTAQQTLQGWPDSPGPAMTSMPSTPSAQFGGASHALHSSARSWAERSQQSDKQGTADWTQDLWEEPAQRSTNPWEHDAPSAQHSAPVSQGKGPQGKAPQGWGSGKQSKGKWVNADWTVGNPSHQQWSQSPAPQRAQQEAAPSLQPSAQIETPLRWWGARPYYLNAKSNTWLCAFQCTQTHCPHGRPPCNYKPSVIAQDVRSPHICSLCKAEQRNQREVKGQWG